MMKTITAGWETDLAILEHTGSQVDVHDDFLVVKSPHNPEYHWGNFILVTNKKLVSDSGKWLKIFESHFPEAKWLAIGLPEYPKSMDGWGSCGAEVERMDVLKAIAKPATPEIASGYTSRILGGNDWDLLLAREISENLKSGDHDLESFERFITKSIDSYRTLSDRGLAAWFGVFHESELVADLGIVLCGDTARYQSVQTDAKHRRKGLASHLLGQAASWAYSKGCKSWVIVTESTNGAGRVYRRAGFVSDLETVSVYRSEKMKLPRIN